MWRRTVAALVMALVVEGCSDPVAAESDILLAEMSSSHLELRNRTAVPVYYFAVDDQTAAVIDWAPCTDPPQCEAIPAQATRRVLLADLHIREDASHLIVFHWRLVAGVGQSGYAVDSLRALRVDLP
jgi:hypothetical protein